MNYTIEWLIPDRVVYVAVPKGVGINHWGEIQAAMFEFVHNGTAPVHVIMQTDIDPALATNVNDIKRTSGLQRMKSDKLGWMFIVQNHVLVRLFGTVAIQFVGATNRYQFVATMGEAFNALRHIDPTLREIDFSIGLIPSSDPA